MEEIKPVPIFYPLSKKGFVRVYKAFFTEGIKDNQTK
jgi:hypothetical protein